MQDIPEKHRKPRKPESDDLPATGSDEPGGDDAQEPDTEKTSAPATHDPKLAAAGEEKARGKKDRTAEPRPEEEKTGAPSVSLAQRMRFKRGGQQPRR